MKFDGLVDALQLGSATVLDNIFAGGGTLTAWIKAAGWGESNFGRIMNKTTSTFQADGWGWYLDNSDTVESMQFGHGFSGVAAGRWTTPANSISLNTWHHVAISYDNSDIANDPIIYIDGISQTLAEAATPSGTADDDSAENLAIGNLSATVTDRAFDGAIADARIYDRILDATEIEIIANGHGVDGIITGMVARLPLDDAADVSGQDLVADVGEATIGGSTTITVPVPVHKDGDVLLLVVVSGGDTTTAEAVTTPSGWTHINSGQTDLPSTASTPSVWIYRRTASSEPANYIVTGDTTCTKVGSIISVRDVATTEDVISSINTGTDSSPIAPSITAGGNAVAIWICACDDNDLDDDSQTNSPSGTNTRVSKDEIGTGNGAGLVVATELVNAGSTGTRTFALAGAEEWGCLSLTFLGGKGARADYVADVSDTALPVTIQGSPFFQEDHPNIKSRRA